MSETKKTLAAVGAFSIDGPVGDVPAGAAEALKDLEELLADYEMGDVITEEDLTVLRACLPIVGADNLRLSVDGALVGEENYEFKAVGCGCEFAASGYLGSEGHGEGRTDMWLTMQVDKLAGSVDVLSYTFVFRAYSFGTGPSGAMKVLFEREFRREFEGADSAAASYYDLSTNTQTGFLYTAECIVQTTDGAFVIR